MNMKKVVADTTVKEFLQTLNDNFDEITLDKLDAQKKISISASKPSDSEGENGDICIVIEN